MPLRSSRFLPNRTRVGLALCTAIAVAMGPAGAGAKGPAADRVGVMPPIFEGSQGEAWEQQLEEALLRGLVQGGLDVTGPDEVAHKAGVDHCDNERCLGFVSQSIDAKYLVRSRISGKDKNYGFELDVVEGQTGELVATTSETCELCGIAEAAELLTKQAAGINQKLETMALGPATFTFTSKPEGARVRIDGELVGTAPLEHQLEAGEYTLEVTLPGHLPVTRKLNAVRGLEESVDVTLQIDPDNERKPNPRSRAFTIAGATSTGVGVAALASGVTFLVLDERSYQAACTGGDVDIMGNCRQRYDTMLHGIVLSTAAGALLATGIGLLVVGRKARNKQGHREQARLQWGVHPRGLVLSGSF